MNSAYVIRGGRPLHGTLRVHGAKNSALPILAASILGRGTKEIKNCPNLSDVDATLRILRELGCTAERDGSVVRVNPDSMNRCDIPDSQMREMRSSVSFLGAILARTGEVRISLPGGCELGSRPIDLHLSALRSMGAEVIAEPGGHLLCRASNLTGCELNLAFPSVGATENIMLAATAAEGITRITNAAREPEIEDLQAFMQACGANVSGAGTSTVTIEGGWPLSEASHTVIPDRIAAATYLSAAAITGGMITLESVCPTHLSTVTAVLAESGCDLQIGSDTISLACLRPIKAMRPIRTMPYPGFPTDAQSPIMALASCAEGTTIFRENIFENRYQHVGELARMGADIKVDGRVAVVCGVPHLSGARVSATDLRGGAALVVAALGAKGESHITGLRHIGRGYENFEQNLSVLGADIGRIETYVG